MDDEMIAIEEIDHMKCIQFAVLYQTDSLKQYMEKQ